MNQEQKIQELERRIEAIENVNQGFVQKLLQAGILFLNGYVDYWSGVSGARLNRVLFLRSKDQNHVVTGQSGRHIGTFRRTSATTMNSPGSNLANDMRLHVFAADDGALPSPLVETSIYFVVNATVDTFQLSNSQGGSAISTSNAGQGIFYWEIL